MSNFKVWIQAMRLRTLPLSVSGILLGSGVAHYNGYWDTKIFSLAITTTILFQILSNFANDLGDGLKGTDNKNRIGPERTIQSGSISKEKMKRALILLTFLSLLSAGLLILFSSREMPSNVILVYVILTVLCIIAAITYTIGKKAYGYYGLGDLMVIIFFGGVSVLGSYSLFSKNFSLDNINLALFAGLLSTAVLNLNNMRDYSNDAKSGKRTLVVKMGPNNAKFYHMLLIIGGITSLFLFLLQLKQNSLFVCLIPAAILLYHLYKVMKTQRAADFDPELKKVALSTFAISLILTIGLIML